MILVDTSVWIDHLRNADKSLQELLTVGQVLCHPFIIGELALGNLRNRTQIIQHLARLPRAVVAGDGEVLAMIGALGLAGRGIGLVDAHLLASSRLSNAGLWCRDKRLIAVASDLGISYKENRQLP